MSRNRCCVPGCVESGNSHSVLHGFPNPENYLDLGFMLNKNSIVTDPVYFASEVASQQSIHQNKENVISIVGANKVIAVRKLTKRVTATKSEKELHRKIRALKMKLGKCQNKSNYLFQYGISCR
ncbi:unnamed protein product [Parnassius apollo]|uniref:(apollo) hypothetical protein n=1 Tax=Parnassius apollo TaxID=110799 RepID=A0A8S3WA17_PARAO|nr:unnamed protein product [Parnassius apollo]